MPAVLERTLYLPSEVGGSGAGSKRDMLWFVEEVGFVLMVWWLSGLAEAVELSEGGMQWFKKEGRLGATQRKTSVLNTRVPM